MKELLICVLVAGSLEVIRSFVASQGRCRGAWQHLRMDPEHRKQVLDELLRAGVLPTPNQPEPGPFGQFLLFLSVLAFHFIKGGLLGGIVLWIVWWAISL